MTKQTIHPFTRAMLLNVLWHHQGGSSQVGQPIREMLGIPEYAQLTDWQVKVAQEIEALVRPMPGSISDELQALRRLLDSRPAMNAGLSNAYALWNNAVYAERMLIAKQPANDSAAQQPGDTPAMRNALQWIVQKHDEGQFIDGECIAQARAALALAPAEAQADPVAGNNAAWAEGFSAGESWRQDVVTFWETNDYGKSPAQPANPYPAIAPQAENNSSPPMYATDAMVAAAEGVEDLHRRGTPDTWRKVWRAMYSAAAPKENDAL